MKDGYLRGAAQAAPRTGPLTIVTAAVAGEDLESVARSAAGALGCPVAIALPELGPPVAWPPDASAPATLEAVRAYAAALVGDAPAALPDAVGHAVPVRIGARIVGVVAALARNGIDPGSWLDAAAAAAAVTALMGDSSGVQTVSARRAFLQMLELQAPADVEAMLVQARRLGCDLAGGATAVCAEAAPGLGLGDGLFADMGDGRALGLVPRGSEDLLDRLRASWNAVAVSTTAREPALLHDALREAAILFELSTDPGAQLSANEETYRLLLGVLLSNPDELERLRASTISELERYDAVHDTGLLATLESFFAHHGSTTETAEAMRLHRHTVGYRLARVQEVSGLSPYESDGRERLSLGIKAHRILVAERRRAERRRPG